MNRDISQLIALLAGMQSDLVSLRTGLAGLAKDIQTLNSSIQVVDPEGIARAVTIAAGTGAAKQVAIAAGSARSASQSAQSVADMALTSMRSMRRWKAAAFALAVVLIFVAGFGSSALVGVWDRYGCSAHGGDWVTQTDVTACVFR